MDVTIGNLVALLSLPTNIIRLMENIGDNRNVSVESGGDGNHECNR